VVKRYEHAAEGCSEEEGHGAKVVLAVAMADVVGGLFIVTGGLGGLGLLTAKLLAGLGTARPLLLSWPGEVSQEGQGSEGKLS